MIRKTATITLVAMTLIASSVAAPRAQAQTDSEPGTTWPINN